MRKFLSDEEDYYLATECASEIIAKYAPAENFAKLQDFFLIKSFKCDAFEIAIALKKADILSEKICFGMVDIINEYCIKYAELLGES